MSETHPPNQPPPKKARVQGQPVGRDVEAARDASGLTGAMRVALAKVAEGWSTDAAAKAARVGRRQLIHWRDQVPAFAVAWDEAIEAGADRLEDVIAGLAVDEGVTPRDRIRAASAMLAARRPEVWDRQAYALEQAANAGGLLVLGVGDAARREALGLPAESVPEVVEGEVVDADAPTDTDSDPPQPVQNEEGGPA